MSGLERTSLLDVAPLVGLRDRDRTAGSDSIHEAYLKDRDAVKSANELRRLIDKWRPMFLLSAGPLRVRKGSWADKAKRELSKEEVRLLQGRYNAASVLRFMKGYEGRSGKPLPKRLPEGLRIAMCVMLPPPMLTAFLLANHYGVGSDLGMIRLYLDTYPEHDGELRGWT